jgi:hypothetical protein
LVANFHFFEPFGVAVFNIDATQMPELGEHITITDEYVRHAASYNTVSDLSSGAYNTSKLNILQIDENWSRFTRTSFVDRSLIVRTSFSDRSPRSI